MTSDILCERLSHDISAKLQWVLVDWAHKSIVDAQKCAMTVTNICNLTDVNYLKSWVSRSLKPDLTSIWSELSLEFFNITEIVKCELDMRVWPKNLRKIALRLAINIIDTNDMIPFLAQVHDSSIGSHSTVCRKCKVSQLERSQLPLQCQSRWIPAPCIVEDNG